MTCCPVNYFLPAADLLRGSLHVGTKKTPKVTQLYALRFFVGALGGFSFSTVQGYLGCWYKRSELSRRGAVFFIASQVDSLSSGYIQAAAYARLDGRYGIKDGDGYTSAASHHHSRRFPRSTPVAQHPGQLQLAVLER